MTTLTAVGLPPLTPVGLGAPEGTAYGDLGVGLIAVLIVVACWRYARG